MERWRGGEEEKWIIVSEFMKDCIKGAKWNLFSPRSRCSYSMVVLAMLPWLLSCLETPGYLLV